MDFVVIIPDNIKRVIAKRFNRELRRRLYKKLRKLEDEPKIFGKPLSGPLAGTWEFYFEKSWRILYSINESDKKVYIEAIWHKDDF